jgi:hypothetical protein
MKAWKHHIAEHFEDDSVNWDAGAAAGATIFLDYDFMIQYLKKDGRRWCVAELSVEKNEILYDFKNKEMVTLTVNKNTVTQFDYV